MRSITLSSQSVLLRTHSLPSSSSPPKPLKSLQICLGSPFNDQISKLSRRNLSLFLSRYPGQQCVNISKEFKFLKCNICKAIQWMNNADDCRVSNKSPSNKRIGRRNFIPRDVPVPNAPFHSYLKFVLLFGLFTLECTQQAVANSDFASGLQSVPYLGDLGDISTGFASVRKISL